MKSKLTKLFTLLTILTLGITNVWAAASTTTDGKYATGTIDFSTIGTLSGTTTYWHNGVKFYSGNATSISANNTAWSTSVSIPAYVSNVTAGKDANKCKWGNAGTAKQYTQSGFACSQHTIGIHVNQACTLTVVVNKNLGSDTDDAGITASIDGVAYGTAYSSSTYKAAGSTALTVTSARADKTNASGRYTLTIVVTAGDLTDGEAVVKMFNGSSGTGSGKLFCWESITVTPAAVTKHTVTYKAGDGSGSDVVDSDAKTVKAFADCSFTAPSGYEFKEWQDGSSNVVAAGATVSADMTLTAIYRLIPTKYTVTYNLNGASGDAPTETDKAAGDAFNLAAAPSWAGHAFDGWLCSADAAVKVAGSAYTMTAANTTFTAQWHEVDCKIYSLTGEIGSAEGTAGDYEVTASTLILKNSNARIKLTPAGGETFKAGDVITISGFTGNAAKKLGVYVKNAAGSSNIATVEEANLGDGFASATLSADAEYVFLARKEGTTMNVLTCEIHRSCAEGVAAGLSYAETEVNKTEGDAAFTNTLANANGLVVMYSSSNTAVATVATNGQVTIVGAGSATITANSAIQTKAGTLYAAGTASYSLTVAALPKYHVTYDLNGGSGDVAEVDHKAGEKFTLHDGVTGVTAPGSKTFVNWKDQDDALFDGGVEYTMPAKDVTLTAQWAGDVYTVKFMDGETVLDTKVVEVGSHPTDIEHPTKPLYTFAAWQLSGSDVVLDDVTGTKDATVILTARWTAAYALDVNFKDAATQALGVETALNTYHYASDASDISFEAKGLKIKTNAARFYFNVAPGKVAEIKFGDISGATYSVDGGAAETLSASQLKATYSASAQSCVMTMTTAAYNIVEKITIHDPYTVSFDANGGDDVASLNGTPSVILPSATKGTESFLGWFDGETKVGEAGDKYTPTANITLKAHWEAVSTDTRISALTYTLGAAAPVDIYEADKNTFNIALPYAQAYDAITVAATPNHASASIKAGAELTVSSIPGTATFTIVAQSGAEENYTVNFTKAQKDGLSIIKAIADATSQDIKAENLSGLYKKAGHIYTSGSYKLDQKRYFMVQLEDGKNFQEGDVVEINVSSVNDCNGFTIYSNISGDDFADGDLIVDTHDETGAAAKVSAGINKITLPSYAGSNKLYVARKNGTEKYLNAGINQVEVKRAMNPVLTAIQFNSTDVEVTSTTVAVLLPQGTNLGTMTVTPTIYWNGAGTAVVTSNAGAWAWGANTYRVTDKDGDYTDYAITLTEDELKHTVSFNTHGGSTIDPVQVVDGQKLAAAPADPTKEDYIFQGWAETADGAVVDVTTFTISADKEFHAIWASDGAIKLLDGATVNHTNFITGVTADETVEFMGNTVNYAKFSGTVSGVNGVKDLTRVIAYNATTNKTKIRISAHNNSTNARSILVKGLVEGANAAVDLATIDLGNKEDKVSDWIEFDNAANRTIYIMVSSSAGDVYFTQVKVIESGETPMKQAGEAGYALNLNKGRFFGLASTDLAFEGLNARLSGDYTALNSGYAKLASTSMSFTVASAMTLSVTTNNNKTYYVTKGAAGTDNETAKTGVSKFNLTAGTWYITAGSDEVQFTNIAFAAPHTITFDSDGGSEVASMYVADGEAAVKPADPTKDSWDFDGWYLGTDPYDWTAPVTSDLALTAHWKIPAPKYTVTYELNGGEGVAPTETDKAEDDVFALAAAPSRTDYNFTGWLCNIDAVTYSAGADYTMTAAATTFTAQWVEKDCKIYSLTGAIGGAEAYADNSNVEITADMLKLKSSNARIRINPSAYETFKAGDVVSISGTVGNTSKKFGVIIYAENGSTKIGEIAVAGSTAILQGSATLSADAEYLLLKREDGTTETFYTFEVSRSCAAGTAADFAYAEGTVTKKLHDPAFINPLTNDNGLAVIYHSSNLDVAKVDALTGQVEMKGAGTATITAYAGPQTKAGVLYEAGSATYSITVKGPDYKRDVSNNIGTLCVDHNVPAAGLVGATFYQLVGKEPTYGKLVFDEVTELVAGEPYIFESTTGSIALYYGETVADNPVEVNHMIGSYVDTKVTITEENKKSVMYISNNKLWDCSDYLDWTSQEQKLQVVANRAYIANYDAIEAPTSASPAPGRRRITVGKDGQNAATGIGNVQGDEVQSTKVLINGELFILRGEKMYDATGRMVK